MLAAGRCLVSKCGNFLATDCNLLITSLRDVVCDIASVDEGQGWKRDFGAASNVLSYSEFSDAFVGQNFHKVELNLHNMSYNIPPNVVMHRQEASVLV
jgi:hypothetical protein